MTVIARTLTLALLIPLCLGPGCATYALYTTDLREQLAITDYDGFLTSLSRARKGPNQLLYLMEKGLVERYRGDYRQSNDAFDRAERLSDRLFTRSLSREVASLVTHDAVRDYRGDPHELVFIHYYRALNYWQLGQPEDALVECRKANLRLSRLTGLDSTAARNDAFIHYVTGLFYEAAGELNDALVSYRNAAAAYRAYERTFGVSPPPGLAVDLARVAWLQGDSEGHPPAAGDLHPPAGQGELVLFCETGFVPRKTQVEINLPLYEAELKGRGPEDAMSLSRQIVRRYRGGGPNLPDRLVTSRTPFFRPPDLRVKYWLRVALPACPESAQQTRTLRLSASGIQAGTEVAEDLSAIARSTFDHQYPAVMLRTVARGVSKYLASEAVDRKNKVLGFFANLFAASTEAADTRSWVSLPHTVQIGRLRLPAGAQRVTVEALDNRGGVVDRAVLDGVEIRAGERPCLSWRTYK